MKWRAEHIVILTGNRRKTTLAKYTGTLKEIGDYEPLFSNLLELEPSDENFIADIRPGEHLEPRLSKTIKGGQLE